MEDKVKVRFIKNLKFYADAVCLFWINEIHIDESFKNSPVLDDIIRHEMKHWEIFHKAAASNFFKRKLLLLYNNVWDVFSCTKIEFKHFRVFKKECILTLVGLATLILIAFVWLKVIP